MLLDYGKLEPALAAWVAQLADLDVRFVLFEHAAQGRHAGRRAVLSWTSDDDTARETRWDADPAVPIPGANVAPLQVTWSELGLQIGFESWDPRGAHHARAMAAALRARAFRPASLTALRAHNLALRDVGPATAADYDADDHWVSRVVLELRLGAVATERATKPADLATTIETVEVTSDVAGVAAPTENMDHERIPAE